MIDDGFGRPIHIDPNKTPYLKGIMDALDTPGVRVVGVQASARWGKTQSWECHLGKKMTYGPRPRALFYMQSKDDLQSYVDERLQWMVENNEGLSSLVDWNDSRNGRFRWEFLGALFELFAATQKTTRSKSAALIGCDEVDAMDVRVRKGLLNLVLNRQRERGGNAMAYFASHPDQGYNDGIAKIIADGLRHLWYWSCLDCGLASSPAKEADLTGDRINWNINDIVKSAVEGDIDRLELLRAVEASAKLICPHCGTEIDDRMRLEMSAGGVWLQPTQKLERPGVVVGEAHVSKIMGFVGHAFMSPFVKIAELASEWASAKMTFDLTQDDKALKEVEVKSLGLVFETSAGGVRIDDEKTVQHRLTIGYDLKTVPAGVVFLTSFVDVQGDRFEVRVIGWSLQGESWLIDAFALKQWPGFQNIDPANRLMDWDIIEQAVINQTYPLQSNPDLFLPIARVAVNNAGVGDKVLGTVTDKGRQWAANLIVKGVESWRVQLFQGSRSPVGERYGRPRQVAIDDHGRPLATTIYERSPNVHEIKKIIARRMQIPERGVPGRMNLPANLSKRYVKELVAEKMINDVWVRSGANETWDGWVACEVAREGLKPDRPELWEGGHMPPWATPLPRGKLLGGDTKSESGYYDRLLGLNSSE